jgi:hypothetical protein
MTKEPPSGGRDDHAQTCARWLCGIGTAGSVCADAVTPVHLIKIWRLNVAAYNTAEIIGFK